MRRSTNFWAPFEGQIPAIAQTSGAGNIYNNGGPFWLFSRRWKVLVGTTLIGAVVGLAWLLQVTPIYTATTTLMMDVRRQHLMQSETVVSELASDASGIATELSLIQSFAVARRVVERLKLVDDPDFNSGVSRPGVLDQLASLTGRSGGDAEDVERKTAPTAAAAEGEPTPAALSAIGAVQTGTQVQRVGATWFINISFSHPEPKVAARLANAVADTYLVDQLEARYQSAKRATGWLRERVTLLRQQVEASERAVAEHRAKHNLVTPGAGTLTDQQATAINTELVAAHADAVQKRSKYDQARGILEGGKIESVAEIMQSPTIATLRASETQSAHEEADLLTRYGPEHPEVRKVRAQRADLKRQTIAEIGRVVSTLMTDYELAQKREETLEKSLRELTGGNRDVVNEQAMIRLRELDREAQADKALYESLLARFKEAEQQTNLPANETRVVAPALTPSAPSYPNKQRIFLTALLGGLLVGCGLVYLMDYAESGFTSLEQLESVLQLPVLAMVPQLSSRERQQEGTQLSIPEYLTQKPLSCFSESVRSIRVSVQMSNIAESPQLLLVTSATPSEGKTTMSQCLAYSAAAGGQKVLMIDCDLRHPSLTEQFGLVGSLGLGNLMAGQASGDAVFNSGPTPNLTILPAGTIMHNPPDILGSEKMRLLLQQLRSNYDFIVLDTPPVAPVIDSVMLSKLVDKVVFVVQWRTTPRDVVERAINIIEEVDRKIAGIVFNNVQVRRVSVYSASYGYHNRRHRGYYEQ
jgi:polysaccharide biosynthesis transport protein